MNLRQFLQSLFGFLFLLNYCHVLLFLLFFFFYFFFFFDFWLWVWGFSHFWILLVWNSFYFFNPSIPSSLSFSEIVVGTFINFGLIEVDSWILDYILHCDCLVHKFIFIFILAQHTIYGFDLEVASLVDCWVPNDFDLNYFVFNKYFFI